MLQRIRQAVAEGNRAGTVPGLPQRGQIGYQGGGDPVTRFCAELSAVGGNAHLVLNPQKAAELVMELVMAKGAKRVLIGRGSVLDVLLLPQRLRDRSLHVEMVDALDRAAAKEIFFQADIGISGVAYAIAETGTRVMRSGPSDPRSLSLLPPVHIAIVGRSQLLPDLFDWFAVLESQKAEFPSCFSLITGPSKTGDIELKLVTGVHGPGELHALVIDDA
jgi:L-lactate utilization protein LutC